MDLENLDKTGLKYLNYSLLSLFVISTPIIIYGLNQNIQENTRGIEQILQATKNENLNFCPNTQKYKICPNKNYQ